MYTSFKEMPVWQAAMEIAEEIFKLSETFLKKEDYGLTSQLRRSALSMSANIAEAYERDHTLDKVNFYYYARGSVTETQSHLEYTRRVGYSKESKIAILDKRLEKVYNDLNKIIIALKSDLSPITHHLSP
jgi:four helix bundle protein